MNCPHCGHDKSRVTETRASADGDRRIRLCRSCGRTFTTIERVTVYFGRNTGWMEVVPQQELAPAAPLPEPVQAAAEESSAPEPPAAVPIAKARQQRIPRFMPTDVPDDMGVVAEAAPLLLQWWCEARRSKHGNKAVWTEGAWLSSCRRVGELPARQQIALAQAGCEAGWQALKADYLEHLPAARQQPATGRPMPRDPAMLAALDSWPA